MTTPATTGQLRTRIQAMQIGDYIKCHYNANNTAKTAAGHFFAFAQDTIATELAIDGASVVTQQGFFYLIKVDVGLLIADRIVRNTITWDVLNSSKYIQGRPQERDGTGYDFGFDCTVRSVTGGVAYADMNGKYSLTDMGLGGWPTNNEWDKYIVSFPASKIQTGKVLDDIFHWKNTSSWCQETVVNGLAHHTGAATIGNSSHRIWRSPAIGLTGAFRNEANYGNFSASTIATSLIGFRPVFEYKEV
ncbi:hypothetical protein ABES58_05870 [Paenibacillus lautus]|uniref:hypothetical protein n=1 Tax=Paenibacillus lautus TaxID=1401 RepID=UPI003D2E5E07